MLNGAPPKRDNANPRSPPRRAKASKSSRRPVWSGQISHRTTYSLSLADGEGAREFDPNSQAATEIAAACSLQAIERSVKSIHGAVSPAKRMHRRAA